MSQGILVIVEHNNAKVNRISIEAVTGAQKLAAATGQPVYAAVLANDCSAMTTELSSKKLDKIYAVANPELADYTPDGYTVALAQLIERIDPAYVIVGHSYQARDYVAKLALRCGGALMSDCIAMNADGGNLTLTKQVFAGKFNADYSFSGEATCFISLQAAAYNADELESGSASVEDFAVNLNKSDIRTTVLEKFEGTKKDVDLAASDIIVAVGRGLKEEANLEIAEELAKALGGDIGASRPVCDDGWVGADRQVGSSGQTVSPKLYLSLGISGAIQHVVGMKGSKYIVAINKDPHAPIFDIADVAVVGDLFEIVPKLTEAVKAAK
ncbi:MAG: electron transfer flavoprotein subunit alpha/FixB family protein [Deferribacteres bacterium]|nr:electron transfer flavoprotein subunit alpha/FixB family protein [candidate division KSB1 bacterium]MCB9502309.1 electron transfer flavoprotein subunit alpha/FixB family protein [Deferribacteres bacterium]